MRIAYVNGSYQHNSEASVHIEDRGYQFADGIYEYIAFYNRKMVDGELHLARLERSLKAMNIDMPMSRAAMNIVIRELIQRNGREDGGLYMQITRGVARRDHPFPKNVRPAFVMTVCGAKIPKAYEVEKGVHVITQPDLRWKRCDVKSVGLLANVMAKQAASARKMREAWLLSDSNEVTEGSVSNAYIVSKGGELITHHADNQILSGVTRDMVLRLARKAGVKVAERPFNLLEAYDAAEAFITSTSANVLPVVSINDKPVGEGKPGPVSQKLLSLYLQHIYEQTGKRL